MIPGGDRDKIKYCNAARSALCFLALTLQTSKLRALQNRALTEVFSAGLRAVFYVKIQSAILCMLTFQIHVCRGELVYK